MASGGRFRGEISDAPAFQFATDDRAAEVRERKRGRVELIAVGGPRSERATENADREPVSPLLLCSLAWETDRVRTAARKEKRHRFERDGRTRTRLTKVGKAVRVQRARGR